MVAAVAGLVGAGCAGTAAARLPSVTASTGYEAAAAPSVTSQISGSTSGQAAITLAAVDLPAITFREAMPAMLGADAKARRYADMSASACFSEVARRELPAAKVKTRAGGIAAPMRLHGALHGVKLSVPPDSTKFGMLDCRMVLVLDDLTARLSQAGVVGITFDNFYRPNAKLPGKKKSSQHAFGLAADITAFQLEDGTRLTTSMWGASIGDVACGPDAVMATPTPESVAVRNLVCDIGRSGLFNTMLTPSFNAAHQSHFHFDIKEDTAQTAVR